MKKIIFLLLASFLLFSCKKKATLKVQNKVSSVTISSIRWGDNSLSGSILPGESTAIRTFRGVDIHFPESHKLTFRMSTNNQEVYLETVEEYTLNEGEDKTIIISNDTQVVNP